MPSVVAPVTNETTKPYKVLVVGGSYAGLTSALILLDLCHGRSPRFVPTETPVSTEQIPVEVTVVDERDGFFHLIGAPLALASEEIAPKFWRKFSDIPALKSAPGLRCVHGSVESIDCERKAAKIMKHGSAKSFEETYDFLVVASGLRRVWPTVPQSRTEKEYLKEALNHIKLVENADKGVVVVGGGAVGIEMAAEIKEHFPTLNVKLVHSRGRLLSAEDLPDDFADAAATLLEEIGVDVVLGQRVTKTRELAPTLQELTLSDGTTLHASIVISAISRITSTSSFLPSGALDNEGYVKVSSNMNFLPEIPNYTHHYAAGDIVRWSGIKRAGAAMHMGQMAARNIHQRMLNELGHLGVGKEMKFTELTPIPPMMGLAVGHLGACYGPDEGTKSGEEIRKLFFGDDMGFSICWNYMRLGEEFGL